MTEGQEHPRLLRHTLGTIDALNQNSAHQFATKHALVHYASGSVFTFIPKNACTSLRVSLAMANGAIAQSSDWTWVHKNNSTFSASLPELLRASETVVILRCPFRRLASVFLDKIVSRQAQFWMLRGKSRDEIDPDTFSFREFVEWLSKPHILRADSHWRPQTDFLVYQRYDRVFEMTALAEFAEYFSSATGQPYIDTRSFAGHTTTGFERLDGQCHADTPLAKLTYEKSKGFLPAPSALYDEPLAAKVAKLYAKDINLYRGLVGHDELLFCNH